ncbi:hypothetical protein SAMN06295910_0743 [Allosphingosinicella indica]|uniref:Lipoprotein n=2 Tax=Allosphingosinicella indica TaxID=941907 RepID=A0A1X7G045_9SPHN|nr:hypothetical protein SAMN06295910_0743 [Allosphingosinicella indica]
MRAIPIVLALVFVAGCQKPAADAPAPEVAPKTAEATAPGQPGGLPDDRTPVAEAPIADKGPQGAAQVLQSYFASLEAKEYGAAWKLWSDGGKASGQDAKAFADSFANVAEYHAEIGAPGAPEGAAGSTYVEVPIRVYGKTVGGRDFSERGTAALRRVNDVPGATAEQLQWRIHNMGVAPPAQ